MIFLLIWPISFPLACVAMRVSQPLGIKEVFAVILSLNLFWSRRTKKVYQHAVRVNKLKCRSKFLWESIGLKGFKIFTHSKVSLLIFVQGAFNTFQKYFNKSNFGSWIQELLFNSLWNKWTNKGKAYWQQTPDERNGATPKTSGPQLHNLKSRLKYGFTSTWQPLWWCKHADPGVQASLPPSGVDCYPVSRT